MISRFDTALYNGIQTFTIRQTPGNFYSTKVVNSLTTANGYSTRVEGRIPQMVRPIASLQPTIPANGGSGQFRAFANQTILAESSPQPVQFADVTTARGCSFINAIVESVSGNTINLLVLVQVTFNTVFGGQRVIPFTVRMSVPTKCLSTPTNILIQSVECRLANSTPTLTPGQLLGVTIISIPLNILATLRFNCSGIFRG